MTIRFRSALVSLLGLCVLLLGSLSGALPVHAAASIYATSPGSGKIGDTISVSIYVNTGGQSANTF